MDISKKKTPIMVLIALLWLACIILGTAGYYVLAMCFGVVLMFLHMMLGVAKQGIVSKKFFLYPMLIWAVLWFIAFIGAGYYFDLFDGIMPSFTILGFHPSFAFTIFLYWIGGQLTLNLGLYLYQDEWLSEQDWTDFCKLAHDEKEGK